MSNKMFSEEYEFFPEETRQILEQAGGLKSFLLGCPRFVVIDNCIALKKVASRLKKKRKKKNIKTKVKEISKTREYLRVKLPLNPSAREFKPDVKPKAVPSLSSAPASEAVKPQPVSADSPKPACEAEKPPPVSENSHKLVSEDEKPKEVSPSPPKAASEDASRQRASALCPTPVREDVKTTYWTQAHVVTGYCTYLPFRPFEIPPPPPPYISMVPTMPQYTNLYTPMATISTEYHLQTSVTVMSSYVANDRPDQNAAVYFEGRRRLNVEHASGHQIASETQILQKSFKISVKSQYATAGAARAQIEPSRKDGQRGNLALKQEADPERTDEATNTPQTQAAAIQVRLK